MEKLPFKIDKPYRVKNGQEKVILDDVLLHLAYLNGWLPPEALLNKGYSEGEVEYYNSAFEYLERSVS